MVSTYHDDVEFLQRHAEVVRLTGEGAEVAVVPAYQGRVMTSTCGATGPSFGYLNRPVIAEGRRQPHMTVVGGEDRFWLAPEGGRYAVYFPPGAPMEFEHWQVPLATDFGAWPVVRRDDRSVHFARTLEVANWSGTSFRFEVERSVRVLERGEAAGLLGIDGLPTVDMVAFESLNALVNVGTAPLRRDTGLVGIWILGMFRPGPRATVIVPLNSRSRGGQCAAVRDDYFGPIGEERLRRTGSHVFYRVDGGARGKFGVPWEWARPMVGSYDPDAGCLTIVSYSLPVERAEYLASAWRVEGDPYDGDVIHSYSDGPAGPGGCGAFFELESSSPVRELAVGARVEHRHTTMHLCGAPGVLSEVARAALGVELSQVVELFP